jgi:hypothetical protein
MTKQKFRAAAAPLVFTCPDAGPIKAVPVETKAGALAWVGAVEMLAKVGDEWVKVQVSVRATAITSKTWPDS